MIQRIPLLSYTLKLTWCASADQIMDQQKKLNLSLKWNPMIVRSDEEESDSI